MNKTAFIFLVALCIALKCTGQTFGQEVWSADMSGPYEVIARDGEFRHTKAGSERDMHSALNYAQHGDTARALCIINAYARKLQHIAGHDAPLCLIQCCELVRAMTLLEDRQRAEWRDMVQRAIMPVMARFDAESPYANGNWGAVVNRCRMACAIFLKDSMLYRSAIEYFLHGFDNGSLPHYISETGQCQETGRDQAHVQLGLQALAETCEMAWEQGDDLWGAMDNRLLKGFEYTARYNLGYDVPFETWQDCTGLYCNWTEPGVMNRGKLWDIYLLPYHHYVVRRGLSMPYTKRIVEGEEGKVVVCSNLHEVYTYPAPKGAPLKYDYELYVRPRSSETWKRVDTYMAKVNAGDADGVHTVSETSYAVFDFTGDVFVRVVTRGRKFSSASIRPHYRGVTANVQNDSTLEFLLFQPENLSVEFDGDVASNLLLFTSKLPLPVDEARKMAEGAGRRFECYGAGFYTQDTIRVASNTTLYLTGGSYFTGTFAIDDAENVSIIGRGIARPSSGYEGCHVYRSRNVLVDGLTLNTCPVGGADGVTLHDVHSISHVPWGDGLNVFASSNVFYDRVFCRNSDDCTTAYASRKGFSGNVRNIHMRNSTLWADVAHAIFIGLHGNGLRGDTIERLLYENIDVLGQAERQVDYQGCLAINSGDNNLVRDVTFDNIRIEEIAMGSMLQVRVAWNRKYCTAPGRGVENVLFRNVRYSGRGCCLSVIEGYGPGRMVSNVRFEGLRVNGRTISANMRGKAPWHSCGDYVPMFVGNHAEGIVFADVTH